MLITYITLYLFLEINTKFIFDPRVHLRALKAGMEPAVTPNGPVVQFADFG